MSNTETQERFDDWFKANPLHDCTGPECEHGGSFYIMAIPQDGGMAVSAETHNISPVDVAMAFIQAFDQSVLDSRPEHMPTSVAWSYGREMLRKVVEETAPPADTSASIADFIRSMMDDMTKDTDGE